jgi:hypothetical protein
MYVAKQREGEEGMVIPFRINKITLGKDRDGDPVTTCKIVWEPNRVDVSVVREKAAPRTKGNLQSAIDKVGGLPANLEAVQQAFIKKHGGKGRAPSMAWERALKAAKHLEVVDGVLKVHDKTL